MLYRKHDTRTMYENGWTQEALRLIQEKRNCITVFKLFDKYGLNNCRIELEETFPCHNIDQLLAREGEYVRNTDYCINKQINGRTFKEWYEDNKEQLQEKQKQYYNEHKKVLEEKKGISQFKQRAHKTTTKSLSSGE